MRKTAPPPVAERTPPCLPATAMTAMPFKKSGIFLVVFILFFAFSSSGLAAPPASGSSEETLKSFFLDRRKDQSPNNYSYFMVPYFMQMPGIGEFWGVSGGFDNMFRTEADFYLATMGGSIEGYLASVIDAPIFSDLLYLHIFHNNFGKASIETYGRGMDSDKDDMRVVNSDKIGYSMYMLNLKLLEKRLQFYLSSGSGFFRLKHLVDKDGEKITDVDREETKYEGREAGVIFDFTDDRKDPRKGIRFEVRRNESPRQDSFASEYHAIDYNLTFYIPFGKNTLATNIFRSDAMVTSKGVRDPDLLMKRMGVNCGLITDIGKRKECDKAVKLELEQTIAQNEYGKASPLGGTQYLRSYPQGRFYAAHSLFMGTEFRWNLTQEFTPYDFRLLKGVRTNIQLATFFERGTVADQYSELGKKWRHSYGSGIRLVLAGGFIFRFDVAAGEEGLQTQLFLHYPWGVYF